MILLKAGYRNQAVSLDQSLLSCLFARPQPDIGITAISGKGEFPFGDIAFVHTNDAVVIKYNACKDAFHGPQKLEFSLTFYEGTQSLILEINENHQSLIFDDHGHRETIPSTAVQVFKLPDPSDDQTFTLFLVIPKDAFCFIPAKAFGGLTAWFAAGASGNFHLPECYGEVIFEEPTEKF